MRYKAFKFRLVPNQEQIVLINKTLGCCRFIYNQMLAERQNKYLTKDKTKNKTEKQYKEEFVFLKEVDTVALQQSRIDLNKAYSNFFRRINKKQKTTLKFKSCKHNRSAYRTLNNHGKAIILQDNKVRLPKLGFVKFNKSRDIIGKIKFATISKNVLNQYYISLLCEVETQTLPELDTQIGIDLGLKEFCVISNGDLVGNPRHLRKSESKLKKAQRKLSKRVKGSNRRFKQREKIYKIHEKIRNQRLDFLHKLSTKLINENQVICLEDLNVKDMVKNRHLAKYISDVSWSKFVELLKYKADWYGRTIVKVDKFFPSSKICSNCKNIKKDLTLRDRKYHCDSCGVNVDRDYNASLNILEEGLRILSGRDDRDSSVNIQTLVCSS